MVEISPDLLLITLYHHSNTDKISIVHVQFE